MAHTHHHSPIESSAIQRAFWLNIAFAVIELVGGIVFNSAAILSDAVHDLGDALVLLMSVILERKGRTPASPKYSYGMKRLSVVGALINSMVLLVGTLFICIKGIEGLMNPAPVSAGGMFWLAILGLVANGVSVTRLHGARNILERSVWAHLLEDLLGWGAVLIVSIVIYWTDWYVLDAVLALIIACVVLLNVVRNLKSVYDMVMQASPDVARQKVLQEAIESIDGVAKIDALHWWSLDGESHVLTARITGTPTATPQAIRMAINQLLETYGIVDSTIEIV